MFRWVAKLTLWTLMAIIALNALCSDPPPKLLDRPPTPVEHSLDH